MQIKKRNNVIMVELLPILLGALGVVMVFSAASGLSVYEHVIPVSFKKHLLIFIFAITLFFIASKLKPSFWEIFSEKIMGLSILLLILTYFFGSTINHAKRWLYIGPVSIQPSILAQLALVIFLAKKRDFIISLSVIIVTAGLILFQPDISTAVITVMIGVIMLFINGTDIKKVIILCVTFLLAATVFVITKNYAIHRILSYLKEDSMNQTVRSISTGGLSGLGLGSGMGKFFHIPLPDSDFIFSIMGEELGFMGSFLVMVAFLLYFVSSARYSIRTEKEYYTLVGFGLISMIFINAIIHMLVAIGAIPVTGIPLPFISSGGTALVINFISGGIIVSIAKKGGNSRRRNGGTHIPSPVSG